MFGDITSTIPGLYDPFNSGFTYQPDSHLFDDSLHSAPVDENRLDEPSVIHVVTQKSYNRLSQVESGVAPMVQEENPAFISASLNSPLSAHSLPSVTSSASINKREQLKEEAKKCLLCAEKGLMSVESVWVCQSHGSQWKSLRNKKETLGIKIKEARLALYAQRSDLAQEMGVDLSAVGNWERGVHLPSLKLLPDLAATLEKPLSYFFEDSNNQAISQPLPEKQMSTSQPLVDEDTLVWKSEQKDNTQLTGVSKADLVAIATLCKVCGSNSFQNIENISLCETHISKWMAFTPKSIGEKVRRARNEKGYKQEFLARACARSIDWISQRELGRYTFEFSHLELIANKLKISLAFFFEDEKKTAIGSSSIRKSQMHRTANKCLICAKVAVQQLDTAFVCKRHSDQWKSPNFKSHFGIQMRAAREALGLTSLDVAKKIKEMHCTVSRWDTGQNLPRMRKLSTLAAALKQPLSYFFDVSNNQPVPETLSTPMALETKESDVIPALDQRNFDQLTEH